MAVGGEKSSLTEKLSDQDMVQAVFFENLRTEADEWNLGGMNEGFPGKRNR